MNQRSSVWWQNPTTVPHGQILIPLCPALCLEMHTNVEAASAPRCVTSRANNKAVAGRPPQPRLVRKESSHTSSSHDNIYSLRCSGNLFYFTLLCLSYTHNTITQTSSPPLVPNCLAVSQLLVAFSRVWLQIPWKHDRPRPRT